MGGDSATMSQRPNLTEHGGLPEVRELLAERSTVYASCASHQIDTERKSPEVICEEVLAALRGKV